MHPDGPPPGYDWSESTQRGDPSLPGQYPPPAGLGGPPPRDWYVSPAYGPSPARPGTNGFAIAGLILGIVGGFVLSVIFGCVALSQIKNTGQHGRGMAIAGLVLSGLWLLLIVPIVVVAIASSAGNPSSAPSNETGPNAPGQTVLATSLLPGDCVNGLQNTRSVLGLPAVACVQAHQGEVAAVFDLPAGPYPGQDAIDAQAKSQCVKMLAAYSPSAPTDPNITLFYLYPVQENWTAGDRQIECIAKAVTGTTTGSIKGR